MVRGRSKAGKKPKKQLRRRKPADRRVEDLRERGAHPRRRLGIAPSLWLKPLAPEQWAKVLRWLSRCNAAQTNLKGFLPPLGRSPTIRDQAIPPKAPVLPQLPDETKLDQRPSLAPAVDDVPHTEAMNRPPRSSGRDSSSTTPPDSPHPPADRPNTAQPAEPLRPHKPHMPDRFANRHEA